MWWRQSTFQTQWTVFKQQNFSNCPSLLFLSQAEIAEFAKEGWEYANLFTTRFHAKERKMDFVRRRRWHRKMVMVGGSEGPSELPPIFQMHVDGEVSKSTIYKLVVLNSTCLNCQRWKSYFPLLPVCSRTMLKAAFVTCQECLLHSKVSVLVFIFVVKPNNRSANSVIQPIRKLCHDLDQPRECIAIRVRDLRVSHALT